MLHACLFHLKVNLAGNVNQLPLPLTLETIGYSELKLYIENRHLNEKLIMIVCLKIFVLASPKNCQTQKKLRPCLDKSYFFFKKKPLTFATKFIFFI